MNQMKNHSLKSLAITFVFSGVWDSITAPQYFFFNDANPCMKS